MQERICELQEQQERAQAQRWLEQFIVVNEQCDQLSGSECERLLRKLREPPVFLNDSEAIWAERLIMVIERRLDELDISDILARIRTLKPEVLQKVAEAISDMTEKHK